MSSSKGNKLNLLLASWTKGIPMISAQLKKFGISQQLVNRYVKSKWLISLGKGVFIKIGDQIDWTGALFTLQTELGLSVHVGGKTALDFSGVSHYAHFLGKSIVWLFGKKGEKLPKWFINRKWNRRIKYITPNLFNNEIIGLEEHTSTGFRISTNTLDDIIVPNPANKKNLENYKIVTATASEVLKEISKGYKITVSSIERAALEMLHLVPSQQTLEEAKYLMEGLMTLRPALLQRLLEQCRSIKTKRLFIFLAELCRLPCLEYLDLTKINLGKGKRVIGTGGHYIAKHQISIPKNFVNTFAEELKKYEQSLLSTNQANAATFTNRSARKLFRAKRRNGD